jgi:hypothetical protein
VVGEWYPLHGLEIGSARNVEFADAVWLSGDLVQAAGSGTTTMRGTGGNGIGGSLNLSTVSIRLLERPVAVVGDAILQAVDTITIERTLDTTQGEKAYTAPGRIELLSDGSIWLGEDGDLLAAAGITQVGDGALVYTSAEMVTLAGGIDFAGRVVLTGNVTLDVTSSPQDAVRFRQTIDSGTWPIDEGGGVGDEGEEAGGEGEEAGDEGGSESLGWWLTVLSAGGDVVIEGAVGAESPLGRVAVADARDLTFGGSLRTTGDVVQTGGMGTTELRGTSGDAAAGEGIGGELSLDTVSVRGLEAIVFAAGGVAIRASRDVYLDAAAGLDAGGSAIRIEVGASGLADPGNAFYAAGAAVRTTSEGADAVSLTVANGGSATLGLFAAGTETGVVTVDVGGRILNGMSPDEPNIVAAHASLISGHGIGGIGFHDTQSVFGALNSPLTGLPAPPLAIQVATIDAATTAGDIGLSETDDVELCGIMAPQGRIEIEARGGRMAIRDGTWLRSATGIVSNAPPVYVFAEQNPEDVLLPADPTQEIVGTIGGDSTIDFAPPQWEVGRNFTLIIDWPDGQRGVLRGLVAGDEVVWRVGPNNEGQPQVLHGAVPEGQIRIFVQRTYSLLYLQGVADTEIVTQLTVVNDEGIRLYDQSGTNLNESEPPPTVATSISEDEFRGGGVVPVERELPPVAEAESVVLVETISGTVTQQTRYEEVSLVEERAESDQAVLVLIRVGVNGCEEARTILPVAELQDLSALLERIRRAPLRNGLYRLLHQEPGLPPRKVLEFRKTAEGIGDPVREPGRGSNPRDDRPATQLPAPAAKPLEEPSAGPSEWPSEQPWKQPWKQPSVPPSESPPGREPNSESAASDRSVDANASVEGFFRAASRHFSGKSLLESTNGVGHNLTNGSAQSPGGENVPRSHRSADFLAIESALASADAASLRTAARWRRSMGSDVVDERGISATGIRHTD